MDAELAQLEQKLASLIAHAKALRAANEELRRELAAAHARDHEVRERMQAARARLDAVLARIPQE